MSYISVLDLIFNICVFLLGMCFGLLMTNWWVKKRHGIDVLDMVGKQFRD